MSLLEIDHVSKSFVHHTGTLNVLDDITFVVKENSVVSLLGPSGCGKTTLLRIIAGLEKPDAGAVESKWMGSESDAHFGMLFQSPTLLSWRTVIENVRLPFELGTPARAVDEESIAEVIEAVGLNGFENYLPNKISGGMQARVALARALVLRPPMIILDEPFAAVDMITRSSLCTLLVEVLHRFSSSALVVTHSLTEATLLSDRVLVLSERPAKIVGSVDIGMNKLDRLSHPDDPIVIDAQRRVRELLYRVSRLEQHEVC
jgi:NitT/TauT family transport system ATP-binding protein